MSYFLRKSINARAFNKNGTHSFYAPEYDFFWCCGQSNMQGGSYATNGVVVPDGVEIKADGTIVEQISDPIGMNYGPFAASLGTSLVPSFAQQYQALSGRKVIILHTAKGATGQCPEAAFYENGYWTMYLYNQAKAILDSALITLTNAGYNYAFRGMLWYQGENDNIKGISAAAYTACAQQMINQFFTDYADAHPVSFNMIQIVHSYSTIANAQIPLCNGYTDKNVYLVYNNQQTTTPDLNAAELKAVGVGAADGIIG